MVLDGSHDALFAQVSDSLMDIDAKPSPANDAIHPDDVAVLRLDCADDDHEEQGEEVKNQDENDTGGDVFPSRCTYYVDKHDVGNTDDTCCRFVDLLACVRHVVPAASLTLTLITSDFTTTRIRYELRYHQTTISVHA